MTISQISGVVVASDGTVGAYDSGEMESRGDDSWRKLRKDLRYSDNSYQYSTPDGLRTKNYGWLIYSGGRQEPAVMGIKKLYFTDMMNYLIKYGYYH